MMARKILYVTGARADYGLMRPVLSKIARTPGLSLEIVATGMHLMPEFGMTINEVKSDAFPVHIIDAVFENDDTSSMVRFTARFLCLFNDALSEIRPDIILLLGDRAEMLAAAIAGSYRGISVAHIHGGEVTSTIDEYARHAITKLSHIHMPATKESAQRIIKLGEDPSHVHVVGAPGLDALFDSEPLSEKDLEVKYRVQSKTPFIIVLQHPVSTEEDEASGQMRETLDAVAGLHIPAIVIYPNADAGGRKIIDTIRSYEQNPDFRIFQNIPHPEFIMLLKRSAAIIGNSSSAIIEAPSFGIPAVNIGGRQNGRERGDNVTDVSYVKAEIAGAIVAALKASHGKKGSGKFTNPYGGDGRTAERIAGILLKTPLNDQLLKKRLQY